MCAQAALAELSLFNRRGKSFDAGREFVERLSRETGCRAVMYDIDDDSIFRPDLLVTDVIYTPARTAFLQQAVNRGCRTLNGLRLMLWQAVLAFCLWTGKELPASYAFKLFEEGLKKSFR